MCKMCYWKGHKIQGQGITANGVTNRTLFLLLSIGSTKEGSDFLGDFGKLTFHEHLEKYFIKIGKISSKIHEIGKLKAIF